jgi:nitrite reductase (NADH) large subunit
MSVAAQSFDHHALIDPAPNDRPIVIVGNGPVGMRLAKELLDRLPAQPIVIYGAEQHEPYNRVRLSSWLAGEVDWDQLAQPLQPPLGAQFEERIGYRIDLIDREARTVTDNSGRVQPYDRLVLATGSAPFIPQIPGIQLDGVFTFRDLDDTNRLLARRARSHHTVVIGGGLLGLEAARGMQPANTRVTVVEHADRLLGRQLDEEASSRLQRDVESLGIKVIIGDGVALVTGRDRVERVCLRSGMELHCDTLIIAAGIRPNIQLARSAHLAYGRGVQVDDAMRTSDPFIYAVGECAEHRGQVYGLVAPGLEQAGVAASHIAQQPSQYAGSVAASRLKVVGTQVFSMGPMGDGEDRLYGKAHVYRDEETGAYRKILIRRHRLVGAIGIGAWDETVRLQTTIGRAERIWPWQVLRFNRTGRIWPETDSQGVAAWPAGSVVCQCTGVTRGEISEAIALGACDAAMVATRTGASTVCGSCKPLVADMLGKQQAVDPVPMHRTLLVGGAAALVGALAFFVLPNIPYADSVQHAWHWDALWREALFKQITGFSVLGLFVGGLVVSVRKRTKAFSNIGRFDGWRLAHVLIGVLVILGLVAHTGLRMGSGLNFMLMASFGAMLLIGAVTTAVIALEHRLDVGLARRVRQQSTWLHILLFWPVPALLGWHVFKTYWF